MHYATQQDIHGERARSHPDEGLAGVEALQPLLAGARARGVADAFEMLGIGAILLDASGTVLHVGAAARSLMGDGLCVASQRLIGATPAINQSLQTMIAAAVSPADDACEPMRVSRSTGTPLTLRAIKVPGAGRDVMQLLKAVVVVSEAAPAAR